MREFKIKGTHLEKIHITAWDNVENPVGVIQIIHGMNSYSKRHAQLAEYFNKQGYIVYAGDLVEHGGTRTVPHNDILHIDSKKGIEKLIESPKKLSIWIKEQHSDLKHIMYGHSLGAAILRYLLAKDYMKYDGAIISGTGYRGFSENRNGLRLARSLKLFRQGKKPSSLLDERVFHKIQLSLAEKVEMNDRMEWLTSDVEQTQINLNDKHLQRRVSVSAYYILFKLMSYVNDAINYKHMNKNTPILFISGEHDPLGEFGVGIIRLANDFVDIGMNSVAVKLYKDGRHEMFNEVNKEEVFSDIIEWIETRNLERNKKEEPVDNDEKIDMSLDEDMDIFEEDFEEEEEDFDDFEDEEEDFDILEEE